MATSHETILCGICNEQEVIKNAEKWCPECDEGLCVDCEKHHRISKASRHHAVISIDDYKTLPADISKIYHHCQVHDRKFQMYCRHHDNPCCPLCISKDHGTCTGLIAIEEAIKNVKTSSLMETIEQSLRECRKNIETIINDREQNLSRIKIQRENIQKQITQTRVQINTHLDNLERGAINELDTKEQRKSSDITEFLVKMKEKYKSVIKLQNELSAIKSHASDLQTFLGSKQLEKLADQEDKYIRTLADEDCLQTINLQFKLNEQITNITAISNFGSVTTGKEPPSTVLQMEKDKQAQMKCDVPTVSFDSIRVSLIRKFNLPSGKKPIRLTGCSVLPDQKIAFADCYNNKRIVITNDFGVLDREIFLFYCPYDIACFDEGSIVCTQINQEKLIIINTPSKSIIKTISTTGRCDGITNTGGTVFYCESDKGIQQLDNSTPKTVVRQKLPDMTYVASNENNIYHSDWCLDTVTCYNLNGDNIWEFKDTAILNRPYGVAVNKYSNVYVAASSNVFAISPDGTDIKKVLDGIKSPRALAFDKEKEILVVACYEGEVRLYDISYA